MSDFVYLVKIPGTDTVEGLKEAIKNLDEEARELDEKQAEQAHLANEGIQDLKAKRFALRATLLMMGDKQCREVLQELPKAVLEKLPRELRDMVYTELYRGSQDKPYEITDGDSKHPYDPLHEFAPIVKAFQEPYWMVKEEVGHEFAREAVEIWYKCAHLSVHVKLLQPLLQDDDGVLYEQWSPSVRTCNFLRKLDVIIGPATLPIYLEESRPSGQAVNIRQICRSLSALLEEPSVAQKEGFKLHITFRWAMEDEWSDYLKAICPVVYRLKAQGFLVSGSQAYGHSIYAMCSHFGRDDCECEPWQRGDTRWHILDVFDWFDCSEEECMQRIEEEKDKIWE
ncbi:hypothetical protein J4E89_004628 [Alternaria sp. Ai002NY15]|nr:hypothetical protein J4E89_004628 [Alternaria sp. Ai002NY15]